MKLKLVEFINNNEDWEELLTQKPYCLKINKYQGYILFKYDQINSDFSLDIVKEARGIILRENDYKIVCFPFKKFFNVDEIYADKIDWSTAKVQEKIDGSLIKLWCDTENGVKKWHVSTNGCIDAFQCEIGTDTSKYKTFGELFMSVFDYRTFSQMNPNYTYMFELVSPYTKIVVPYPFIKIYHLSTRDNNTGIELDVDIGIDKPNLYNLHTEKEVKKAAEQLPFNEEGYVVVDKEYNRVKIKSPAYVNAHRLINNKVINTEKVLDLIMQNEQSEFLSYFPEYTEIFKSIQNNYIFYLEQVNKYFNKIVKLKNKSKDRKDFAIKLQKRFNNYKTLGFLIYDNKIDKYEDYINQLSTKKIIEEMNKM